MTAGTRGRYLVLGAAGQLGQALVLSLGEQAIPKTREALDIRDLTRVRRWVAAVRPDAIINCAGLLTPPTDQVMTNDAWETNVVAVDNLAYVAARRDIPFYQMSTSHVFGLDLRRKVPYWEADPVGPVDAFGISKAMAEHTLLRRMRDAHDAPYYIIRTSTLFGLSEQYRLNSVRLLYTALKSTAQPTVTVFDDVVTSLTFIPHFVNALLWFVDQGSAIDPGIYHIAGEELCCWYAVADMMARHLGCSNKLQRQSANAFHSKHPIPRYTALNTERYTSLHGPAIGSWTAGLRKWLAGTMQPDDNTATVEMD